MLRRVTLVRVDVSEELSASFIRVTRIGELGTTLVVTFVFLRSVRRLLGMANVVPISTILVTLMIETLSSPETLVLTRATRRNIPEDAILHSGYYPPSCLLFLHLKHITETSYCLRLQAERTRLSTTGTVSTYGSQ
jgi:hypothetical protein